jgi:ketosteroid isomerase-like protein
MSRENLEIVRKALDAVSNKELAAPFDAGLVSEDVQVQTAFGLTGDKVYIGREGWERFMKLWTDPFDDWTLGVESLTDAGEAVVAQLRQSGRGKESGASVEGEFATVFRLRQGQIVRGEIYMDRAQAFAAAGVSESS